MPGALYLDTSAVLRASLEAGTSPDIERRIAEADVVVTSRLSLVESTRAFLRLRRLGTVPESQLSQVERETDAVWSRCDVWELTPAICDSARSIAPRSLLRTLDALHLATWLAARRALGEVYLLTADDRLREAAESG